VSGSGTEAHREVDPLTDSEAVTLTGKKKPCRKQGFPSPVLFSSPELASERRVAAYRIWISRIGYAAWSYSIEISLPV
jgi:hypothetical protein